MAASDDFGGDTPVEPSRPSEPSRCCGKALLGVHTIYDRLDFTPWWQFLIRVASFAASSASRRANPAAGEEMTPFAASIRFIN